MIEFVDCLVLCQFLFGLVQGMNVLGELVDCICDIIVEVVMVFGGDDIDFVVLLIIIIVEIGDVEEERVVIWFVMNVLFCFDQIVVLYDLIMFVWIGLVVLFDGIWWFNEIGVMWLCFGWFICMFGYVVFIIGFVLLFVLIWQGVIVVFVFGFGIGLLKFVCFFILQLIMLIVVVFVCVVVVFFFVEVIEIGDFIWLFIVFFVIFFFGGVFIMVIVEFVVGQMIFGVFWFIYGFV